MKKMFSEEEYRFSSAKISSMEAQLPSESDIKALCDCQSAEAFFERVRSFGIELPAEKGLETGLCAYLAGVYSSLRSFLPDTGICSLMQARFDCHNIKTAVKCSVLGIDPSPFFIDCGEFSTVAVTAMAQKHDFTQLPKVLSGAARAADEALRSNSSARAADVIMDRACFEYMSERAVAGGSSEAADLFSLKADIVNALTRMRIFRIRNKSAAAAIISDSFVPGGHIPPCRFIEQTDIEGCLRVLSERLSACRSQKLLSLSAGGASTDELALFLDSAFMSEALDLCRGKLLGIFPVIRYIIRVEYLVKNLRIIAAGLTAGKTSDKLSQEVCFYV